MVSTAVVTVVAGRHDRLRRQRAALVGEDLDLHVVVAMGDAAVVEVAAAAGPPARVVDLPVGPERRLPLAAARNAGVAAAAVAGADRVVLLDVDVVAGPGTVGRYAVALAARPDAVLSGPVAYLPAGVTEPAQFAAHPFHPARPVPPPGATPLLADPDLFWSLSFATTVATWQRVGGFDEGYRGYGGEDTDFAQRVLAAGCELRWLGGAPAYHVHHPVSSPPVEHLDDILVNGAVFAARWGRWPMTGWLRAFEERGLVQRCGDGWVRSS